MAANLQLSMLTEAEVNITDYQRCIGSLMYLIIYMYSGIVYLVGITNGHLLFVIGALIL